MYLVFAKMRSRIAKIIVIDKRVQARNLVYLVFAKMRSRIAKIVIDKKEYKPET